MVYALAELCFWSTIKASWKSMTQANVPDSVPSTWPRSTMRGPPEGVTRNGHLPNKFCGPAELNSHPKRRSRSNSPTWFAVCSDFYISTVRIGPDKAHSRQGESPRCKRLRKESESIKKGTNTNSGAIQGKAPPNLTGKYCKCTSHQMKGVRRISRE